MLNPPSILSRVALLVGGAVAATACFEDAPTTDAAETDTDQAATSSTTVSTSASAGTVSTASASGSSSADTSGSGTTPGTTDPPSTDAGTTEDTSIESTTDETSGTGPSDACDGQATGCPNEIDFCGDFEMFDWQNLAPPWSQVINSEGVWREAAVSACGQGALEIEVEAGEQYSVLGAVVADPVTLTAPHRFGARIRFDSECLVDGGNEVRAIALQYLAGGSQNLTAELWFSHDGISLRHGLNQLGATVPIPTEAWLDVEVHIQPGVSMSFRVNEQDESTVEVPLATDYTSTTRAQLLVGPDTDGPFAAPCIQSFDDVYFELFSES